MQQHEKPATFSFIKKINNAKLYNLILNSQLYTLRYNKNRNANKFFKKQIFTVFYVTLKFFNVVLRNPPF